MKKEVIEIIQKIENRRNRKHGLAHFQSYMNSIGNPEKKLKCIHVAGTNGKGSTTNYIRSMLQQAGYRVGTFTSPYLITHLDRIRINDENIDEDEFLALCKQYYNSWIQWDLGMFEIDMMLACVYFKNHNVDFVIFEVGLGGRLDATNIIQPCISLITNIGMDHMELLGDTYDKIAYEKAGIIKDGVDVITTEIKKECLDVFLKQANIHQSDFYQVHTPSCIDYDNGVHFSYKGYDVHLQSNAVYQIANATLALETVLQLKEKNIIKIDQQHILDGLFQAEWKGRFEVMQKDPVVILDGAHNPDGIKALCESLKSYTNVAILFSALKDKKFEEMLDLLETITQDITITHFENSRSMDLSIVKKRENVKIIDDYHEALEEMLKKKKTIVITGSLYFISEIRKYWY